tara:strand:- start:507 stop:812 length:306 start_codon:yes stop_codon:yes gene_type:complete
MTSPILPLWIEVGRVGISTNKPTTRKATMTRTLTVNGITHEVREVWVCMCSSNGSGDSIGDHRWDTPTPKCYRKGGHYRDDLFDLKTGEWVDFAPTEKEAV